MTLIADSLRRVREALRASCEKHGRAADAVALLAVSKTQTADAVRAAVDAGQRAFGENYIQEGVDKIQALADLRASHGLVWHCIGPVQSNKTRVVAEHFDWVETIDRLKIAQRLSEQRPGGLPALNLCVQVNVDGGATKSGVAPDDLGPLLAAVAVLPRVRVRGLMSIPEPAADWATQLAVHQRTRALFDVVAESVARGLLPPMDWDTLSMGMSADMDAAVAAGSTRVRVGTAIFGARAPKS